MVESPDRGLFLASVNEELREIGERLFSVKVQRNLYYSLSGSIGHEKEFVPQQEKHLVENYIAFIIYREAGRRGLVEALVKLFEKGGRRKRAKRRLKR